VTAVQFNHYFQCTSRVCSYNNAANTQKWTSQ